MFTNLPMLGAILLGCVKLMGIFSMGIHGYGTHHMHLSEVYSVHPQLQFNGDIRKFFWNWSKHVKATRNQQDNVMNHANCYAKCWLSDQYTKIGPPTIQFGRFCSRLDMGMLRDVPCSIHVLDDDWWYSWYDGIWLDLIGWWFDDDWMVDCMMFWWMK